MVNVGCPMDTVFESRLQRGADSSPGTPAHRALHVSDSEHSQRDMHTNTKWRSIQERKVQIPSLFGTHLYPTFLTVHAFHHRELH